ncbi:PepSY-associated TM helix domain-containing protein [Komagataeibacter oboediens]|uniref:PepSY domain-containing protein n=1 Tax=Komagataeibacter oboediens TaxID=65958 RepID=A0ABS5SNK6_9PROT|nr:PepSY-associated TM helix domain-containing protein [Komagataeibacter oboediens]MBL7232161.1 PepSY domain-containing protein [Komagataeibacter oboediens]MBT0675796.1 PepSY domain-containing protein [Komagataeibacter oboediens]MBT0677846.1 PepSY domain-containing protein [Komagataeibacter oboediens]MBV0887054.1 PepSY domain-containing protein [Komagataeibacter oboediens]MCK9820394.1 PepSY domain-containing protein [Komagataeibacter oboediens]
MSSAFRKIHRWMGLFLMLPLALQGLTGTLLIILPLLLPERPHVTDSGAPAGAEAVVAASRTHAPAGMIPLRLNPARWNGDSAMVTYGPAGERHPTFEVFVNPDHPSVISTYVVPAYIRFLHNVHADLFLLPYGQTATGIMGVVLSLLAFTGLIIWWPHPALWQNGKWRRTIIISRRARGLRLWREIHVSLGFWLSFMLLFLSLSGAILAFPFARPLFGINGPDKRHNHPHHTALPAVAGETGLDTGLAALKRQMPEATLLSVQLGEQPTQQAFEVILPAYGPNHPATVQYDPHTEHVRISRDPGQIRRGEWTFQWLHMMHETKLVAPALIAVIWKTAVGTGGIGLIILAFSGVGLWAMRRYGAARRESGN